MELLLIVSAGEAKQLQERANLEHIRAVARAESLDATRARFLRQSLDCDAAVRLLEEALINLDEDEFDDFETAQAKAEKFARIEREVDRTIARWESALLRCGWEIKEAQRST
jgi:hypothetical protein